MDFIRVGEQVASIEVELFHPDQENVVIFRQFDRNGKNVWTINGKKSGVREVERKVAEFRIQVDNLCQFLPQDKVHDFSRLNSKGLLDSTVDAVGDMSLKEKHNQLKVLQKSMNEGEELFERKKQMLVDATEKCRRLEEEVKAFDEKKNIEGKISLAETKRSWCQLMEAGKLHHDEKKKCDLAKQKYSQEEEKFDPLKNEIEGIRKKKSKLEAKSQTLNASYRTCTGNARIHSQNIESLEERVDDADRELERIESTEAEKKKNISNLQRNIAELEAEYASTEDDVNLGPQCQAARKRTEELTTAFNVKSGEVNTLKYERSHLVRQVSDRQEELRRLDDVEKMKLNKLRQINQDTFEATLWLRQNRNLFTHEVQEPFIMCANVHDTQFSKYLENVISNRDLTAFFFASSDDMNRFLTTCREQRGWKKVSAVKMPGNSGQFNPPVPVHSLKRFGFISYLKDLVSAPDSVMAYMCHNFRLHSVPVFKEEADKNYNKLTGEFGFTKLFIGNKINVIQGSQYSSAKTTMTREIATNRYLDIKKDEDKENYLNNEINQIEDNLRRIDGNLKALGSQVDNISQELEAARKEQKSLEQKRHFKARQGAMIEGQKRILRQKMTEVGSEREKEEVRMRKKSLVLQSIVSARKLKEVIKELNHTKVKMELCRTATDPLEEIIESKSSDLREAKDKIRDLKKAIESAERNVIIARDALASAMKDTHRMTKELMVTNESLKEGRDPSERITGFGGSKLEAPEKVKQLWEAEKIPNRFEEVDLLINELRAQADCMESVDPRTIRMYDEARDNIEELRRDIEEREQRITDRNLKIQDLKNSWVNCLEDLIGRIHKNFSSHFSSMGFAGEVTLSRGSHEEDFENYGIKIRVKYRDNEPLQVLLLSLFSFNISIKELTAHHQSGGERSVATALYMLALQELTTVPFRCVDEINQGMDARNERRVFELLVRTSCHVSSAQYFLLTPKLLTGLDYSPRMNVLCVYNGPQMCHHTEWQMDTFTRLQG